MSSKLLLTTFGWLIMLRIFARQKLVKLIIVGVSRQEFESW